MKINKGITTLGIIIIVVAVLVLMIGAYFVGINITSSPPNDGNNYRADSNEQNANPGNNINDPIFVTFPKAGDTLMEGRTYSITWVNNSTDVFQVYLENENVGSIRIGQTVVGQTALVWKVPSILSYTSTADNYKGEKPPIDGYKIAFSVFREDATGKMIDYETHTSTIFKIVPTLVSDMLPTPYISAQSGWPPVIQNSDKAYSCVPGSYIPIEIWERTIDGKKYCVKIESEGAMSHIYRKYTYTTVNGTGTKTASFILSWVNDCGPYSDPEFTECQEAQASFDLDSIVDGIFSQ